jgi:hypothetical protein
MYKQKKSRKEQLAENEAFARIISKKIDSIFAPYVIKFSSHFNRLLSKEKFAILIIIFTILFILTFNQWKQIAP